MATYLATEKLHFKIGGNMKIGVRGSKLALAYADKVVALLPQAWPEIKITEIKTQGDIKADQPIHEMGGKGVFVSAIEKQLINKKIDLAIHSFKDLPAQMDERLEIVAVLERQDPRDCYIGVLFPNAKVGTGSPRRIAELTENFNVPFNVRPIRGNIDTRLRKLDEGMYDAIILAVAGLEALGLENRITKRFPLDKMLPCVGQGVIAIQMRKDHPDLRSLQKILNHWNTYYSVMSERKMLQVIDGDCHTAVGAISSIVGDCLMLKSINYTNNKQYEATGKLMDYIQIGEEVGNNIK
ncbi:MAG: hydroxymethylbilane synthase [Euryarchaeota archaeon]|nr:hydroxymethylbilane synthase [Euryarchaeota archaeon]